MTDIVLDSIGSGYNLSKFNANFSEIQRVVNQELLHTYGGNNTMRQDLDMNSQRIINLPEGVSATEPVTVKQLESVAGELAGKSSLPYQVPSFSGTIISLPSAVFYVDVIIDGRMLPPDEFTFVQGNTFITLHEPVDSTQKVVVHRTGLTAGEVAPTTSIAVEIDEYIVAAGSVSQGITDAVAVARSNGKSLVGKHTDKTYILDAPVDLTQLDYVDFTCKIDTTALDATQEWCILMGGTAETDSGGYINFGDVLSSNPALADEPTTNPQIRISGMKGYEVHFDNVRYLQLYAADGVENDSIAYNSFFFKSRIGLVELDGDPSVAGDPRWVNENSFYGGRLYGLIIRDNGYPHNHNKFYNVLMEGSFSQIRIERGDSNWFYNVRWEGVSASQGIYFGESTINNHVYMTWISSLQAREMYQNPMKGAPKTDLGKGNVVAYQNAADAQFRTVFSFDASTTMLSCGSAFNQPSTSLVSGILSSPTIQTGNKRAAVEPGLVFGNKIKIPVEYKQLAESGIIPVKRGSTFGYVANVPSGSWRMIVKAFDENMQPLDDPNAINIPAATYQLSDAGTWISSELGSTNESNTGAQWPITFSVLSDACKYIWTSCNTGSTTGNEVINISCRYYENAQQDFEASAAIDSQPQALYLGSAPTMGIAETGQVVETDLGQYRCDLSLRTRVNGGISSGSTLVIDEGQNSPSTRPVTEGDIVGVVLSDHSVHWSTVSSYDDNTKTVVMVTPIPVGLTVRDRAIAGFCRWISTERGKPYQSKTSSFVAQPNSRYFIRDGLTITTPSSVMIGDVIELIISTEAVDVPGGGFVTLSSTKDITYYDDNGSRIASSTPLTLAGSGQIWTVSEGFVISVIWNGTYWEVSR